MKPVWLTLEVALAVHERILAESGGAEGVRDRGLLESALARPQNRLQYENVDLSELAATYAHGIASNHPFVDGNKRCAFVAAAVFLERNGQVLAADEASAAMMTIGLADKTVALGQYAAWLRENCRKA